MVPKTAINFTLFLLLSCISQTIHSQELQFEDYQIDGVSIRAIEITDDNELWFAGSKGKYGRINNSKLEIDSIAFDDNYLSFRSIAFNGKSIFFMSIENPAIIYKKDVKVPFTDRPYIVYGEGHEKTFYDSMTFFDGKTGIAMGDPTDECLSVVITKDGGNTWNKQECENLPSVIDGEAAFAASNSNIATSKKNVWMVTGGKKARIFYSSNLGRNWDVFDTPIIQGSNMTGIFSVDFYDENKGIIMGGNWEKKDDYSSTKAITTDGGKSWNLIANNEAPGYISCVQYVPKSNGEKIIAVSTEGIYISKNGGVSWKKVSDKPYYTIRLQDDTSAWLAGNEIISKLNLNAVFNE